MTGKLGKVKEPVRHASTRLRRGHHKVARSLTGSARETDVALGADQFAPSRLNDRHELVRLQRAGDRCAAAGLRSANRLC